MPPIPFSVPSLSLFMYRFKPALEELPHHNQQRSSTVMVSSALPAAPHGHSRRLLHHGPLLDPLHKSAAPVVLPAPALRPSSSTSSFDANVIMILAVVLCVFICAVVVSVVVRCVLRVARWAWLEPRACASGCSAAASLATREEALTAVSGPILYASEAGVGSECAICLSEFAPGDSVRVLPNCNHGFHVQCIDRWLASRLSCPTCRRCLFDTCRAVSDDRT